MNLEALIKKQELTVNIDLLTELLAGLQKDHGEIPWSEGGKTDPWDHIESAMGLCIGGYINEARRAYEWLADIQLEPFLLYCRWFVPLLPDHKRH
jgi:hypothetical protein